jgi:hypothetical protein
MLPAVVLAIDPGGMTGLAVYSRLYKPGQRFWCDELPPYEACKHVEYLCSMYASSLAIFWERFTIGQATAKMTRKGVNQTIEVIGVCRYMALRHECQTLMEAPQATPSATEQVVLRKLGWWVPGKNDAQSAAGHMYRWMLRSGNAPPAVLEATGDREQGEGS